MASLRIDTVEGALFLRIEGDLTLDTADSVRDGAYQAISENTAKSCVLDLSDVGFIDSTGTGLLVSLNTRLQGQGRRLMLLHPTRQVIKTLQLVHLTSFFQVFDDEDDLLAALII